MSQANIAQIITDGIIEQLEAGVAPWVKPWRSSPNDGAPHNPASGTYYRGVNFFWLSMLQSSGKYGTSSNWLTYKQAQALGAQVQKGANGVQVVFYKPLSIKDKASGEAKTIPMVKTYTVFNADMIEGLPVDDVEVTPEAIPEFQSHEECEAFIASSGADIRHGGESAFYIPSSDYIQLPNREAFNTPADYYATALHELSHWTGAKHRIDRDFSKSKRFGDSAYAFEELVAELGAAMLCAHNKVDGQLQHASYIESWLKVLREDSRAILKAGAEAQKVLDYLTKAQDIAAEPVEEAA